MARVGSFSKKASSFLSVAGIPVAQVHACFDRDEEVNNPDDQGSKQSTQNGNAKPSNDKLGEINHQGTDQKTDNSSIVRRYTVSEHRFNSPTNEGDYDCGKKGRPEVVNGKTGNQKPDKHQDHCGDDKADNMAHDRQVYPSFGIVSFFILAFLGQDYAQ